MHFFFLRNIKKEKLWPVDFLVVQKKKKVYLFRQLFFYKKTYMHYMDGIGGFYFFRLEMKLYY